MARPVGLVNNNESALTTEETPGFESRKQAKGDKEKERRDLALNGEGRSAAVEKNANTEETRVSSTHFSSIFELPVDSNKDVKQAGRYSELKGGGRGIGKIKTMGKHEYSLPYTPFVRTDEHMTQTDELDGHFGRCLEIDDAENSKPKFLNSLIEGHGSFSELDSVLNSFPLFFCRILYEVEFELKDRTLRTCLFTRSYIQDADLYNNCVKGTKRGFIVPTPDSADIFHKWTEENKLRGMEDGRASSSSSSSSEETVEQIQMRAMGLPGIFGETKKKKNAERQLKERVNEFFRLTNNLGFVGGVNSSPSSCFGQNQIKNFAYKYKSKRSSKVPQYHFTYPGGADASTASVDLTAGKNGADSSLSELERTTSIESDGQNDEEETAEKKEVDRVNVLTKDLSRFDFGFDAERDGHLIAADAKSSVVWSKQVIKYWHQRYRLFSKLDSGVLMDREGWFSVTPERVAEHIAQRMVRRPGAIILDAFTGVGGNAIQFAQQGAYVYAIDLDPIKIRCARRNAEIYGVLDRITFICADFFHVADSFLGSRPAKSRGPNVNESPFGIDAIFLSPPWGGPAYEQSDFDIQTSMGGLDGVEIFRLAEKISPNIGYFLPRNTASAQIIELSNVHKKVEIEQSFLNGKNKAITAYYGNLVK